jgi:hypothetical protein
VAINYALKFVFALVVILRVNTLELYREEFNTLFNGTAGFAFTMLISLIFTVSPPTWALLLVAVVIGIQLSAVLHVAVFVFLLLTLIIVFYARLAPRQSMLILAIVFGFYFRMPYAVVLFAGLYVGVTAIIPVVLGAAVWFFMPFFTNLARNTEAIEGFDLGELLTAFIGVFGDIYAQLTTNLNWVIVGFVFAMMVLSVHLISLLTINYAKEIALGIGTAIGLVCMIMVVTVTDVDMSVGGIVLGCIFSAGLVWVAKFFDNVVDYKRVERVKFDDEDNVYYVKIMPKVKTTVEAAKDEAAKAAAKGGSVDGKMPVGRTPVGRGSVGKAPNPGDKLIPGPSQALKNLYGYGSGKNEKK